MSMTSRRLFGQLLPSYLVMVVAALVIGTAVSVWRSREIQHERATRSLEGQANIVRGIVRGSGGGFDESDLRDLFDQLKENSRSEFTFYSRDGGLIASSSPVDSVESTPELLDAVTQRRSISFRNRGGDEWVYVAVPVTSEQGQLGVIRVGSQLSDFASSGDYGMGTVLGCVALLAVVALAATRVSARQISMPLDQMRAAAERMTRGTTSERLPAPETLELERLADALNEMTAEWSARMQRALHQRNEQEAVLASMVEGVLAVDRDLNVISANQAAAKLLGTNAATAAGQSLEEIVRNSALQSFVSRAVQATAPMEQEITLHQLGRTQVIQVHGARLRDVNGEGIGAVVVLNEVTELRRLEQVRRDFVSNVSHELKTPVTSIKGFVETLLDGAMNDPAEARRFLEIVARQSDRLNAIIEDLLMLSRLEQTDEAADEILETAPIVGPLREAVDLCSPAANTRGITIELACAPDLEARINPNLIQQGVVNLIDNALKYSEDRTSVSVEAMESDDEVLIFVRDQGCGIAADHLPRLFERFYRVDRARSRDLGGTGLGLSIVRHIVQCHHGRVTVESTPGIGSSFCIHLPKPVERAAVARN